MAKRPLVEALGNLTSESTAVQNINENINKLADALQDTLSTSGVTENTMNVPLDMNGQRIINLPTPTLPTDPLRLIDRNLFRGEKGDKGVPGEKGDRGQDGSGVGVGNNLWYNPDASLGDGSPQVLPNTALNIYGIEGWTFQQTGLNPFETVAVVKMPEGDTAVFWMNGLFASGANTYGTGTKTVVPQLKNLQMIPGFTVELVNPENIAQKMFCTVVSYDGTNLVLNATSVVGGGTGTRSNWIVGRNGHTTKGRTTKRVTADAPAGSTTIQFADTTDIEVGATIEFPYDANFKTLNGIQYDTYVVSKTSTTIKISRPTESPAGATGGKAVLATQDLTFYGNQGHYGYQDILLDDCKSLKFGTPAARKTGFSFDVQSNVGGLKASVMFLGYKPSHPFIGRAFTQSFDVTTNRTRVAFMIPGDTEHPDNTWIGEGLAGKWGTLGFAVDSQNSPTSINIPDGAWVTAPGPGFGIGGSEKQTFQLADMPGAYILLTNVKWEVDNLTPYEFPTTIPGRYPTPRIHLRDGTLPRMLIENTGNPANLKKWHYYLKRDGTLGFGRLSDAGVETPAVVLNPDGSVSLPAYPNGDMQINSSKVGTVPYDYLSYNAEAVTTSGSSTFGPISAEYRKLGKTIFVHLSIPVTAVGTGAGAIVASIPFAANGREWFLYGSDSSAGTGAMIYGRIPSGQSQVQIRTAAGAFPAVTGSTLNLSGFYVIP